MLKMNQPLLAVILLVSLAAFAGDGKDKHDKNAPVYDKSGVITRQGYQPTTLPDYSITTEDEHGHLDIVHCDVTDRSVDCYHPAIGLLYTLTFEDGKKMILPDTAFVFRSGRWYRPTYDRTFRPAFYDHPDYAHDIVTPVQYRVVTVNDSIMGGEYACVAMPTPAPPHQHQYEEYCFIIDPFYFKK